MHEHTCNCAKVKYQTVVSGQNGFNTNTKEITRWRCCASTNSSEGLYNKTKRGPKDE